MHGALPDDSAQLLEILSQDDSVSRRIGGLSLLCWLYMILKCLLSCTIENFSPAILPLETVKQALETGRHNLRDGLDALLMDASARSVGSPDHDDADDAEGSLEDLKALREQRETMEFLMGFTEEAIKTRTKLGAKSVATAKR